MRFVKTLYVALLFSLLLGLFSSELAESFSLSDDVTNDFVEDSAKPPADVTQEIRKRSEPTPQKFFGVKPHPQLPAIHPAEATLSSAPDLLRLLTIQRK